jgi:hypothetical protein
MLVIVRDWLQSPPTGTARKSTPSAPASSCYPLAGYRQFSEICLGMFV